MSKAIDTMAAQLAEWKVAQWPPICHLVRVFRDLCFQQKIPAGYPAEWLLYNNF
jgi:hypothetical protein